MTDRLDRCNNYWTPPIPYRSYDTKCSYNFRRAGSSHVTRSTIPTVFVPKFNETNRGRHQQLDCCKGIVLSYSYHYRTLDSLNHLKLLISRSSQYLVPSHHIADRPLCKDSTIPNRRNKSYIIASNRIDSNHWIVV